MVALVQVYGESFQLTGSLLRDFATRVRVTSHSGVQFRYKSSWCIILGFLHVSTWAPTKSDDSQLNVLVNKNERTLRNILTHVEEHYRTQLADIFPARFVFISYEDVHIIA